MMTIGPVSLTVADLPRALAFYTERLGFRVHAAGGGIAQLGAGAGDLLVLVERKEAPRAPGATGLFHFAVLLPSRKALLPPPEGGVLPAVQLLKACSEHKHHHDRDRDEDDDDSHASPGGDMSEREGRTPRPPLLARDYFSVKTNIAAPAGKSSTSGHRAG